MTGKHRCRKGHRGTGGDQGEHEPAMCLTTKKANGVLD